MDAERMEAGGAAGQGDTEHYHGLGHEIRHLLPLGHHHGCRRIFLHKGVFKNTVH
jgi:hypothetical protein